MTSHMGSTNLFGFLPLSDNLILAVIGWWSNGIVCLEVCHTVILIPVNMYMIYLNPLDFSGCKCL